MTSRLGVALLVVAAGGAAALALRPTGDRYNPPSISTRQASAPTATVAASTTLLSVTALAKPRFDWPTPAAIEVHERSLKAENETTMSYVLELCPRSEGRLVVTHRDLKLERVMGRSASDPDIAPAVAQLAPLLSAPPAFVVDRAGNLLEVEGIEQLLSRMQDTLPLKNLEKLKVVLKDAGARNALASAIGERWQAWAGVWAQFDPQQGADQLVQDALPGSPVPVTSQVKVDRIVSSEHVHLSRRTTLAGPQAAGVIQSLLKTLGITDLNLAGYEASVSLSIEAELGWPQLQPKAVRTRKVVSVRHDGKTESQVEEHDYTFGSWSGPPLASCGPSQLERR